MQKLRVLDLFSAACGGWSLGMHRAGFRTIAACEVIAWRRALYQENNPDVRIYDDVCTLTADRLLRDFGFLPDIVVGSPPCQDISSANTKGKGVEGERSGLYFEAIRIIGECRPRWFALENSANLRTRGADKVLAALEALGYTVWSFVVGAGDVGANHERKRSWLIGFDAEQVSYPNGNGKLPSSINGEMGELHSMECAAGDTSRDGRSTRWTRRRSFTASRLSIETCGDANAESERHEGRRPRGYRKDGNGSPSASPSRNDADASQKRPQGVTWRDEQWQSQIAKCANVSTRSEVGGCASSCVDIAEPWADWNGGLAHHLRLDDGLSPWVAGARIAVGGPKGTSAASLIVEAFGDSVCPKIPEAIGRAIIRTEAALSAVLAA